MLIKQEETTTREWVRRVTTGQRQCAFMKPKKVTVSASSDKPSKGDGIVTDGHLISWLYTSSFPFGRSSKAVPRRSIGDPERGVRPRINNASKHIRAKPDKHVECAVQLIAWQGHTIAPRGGWTHAERCGCAAKSLVAIFNLSSVCKCYSHDFK